MKSKTRHILFVFIKLVIAGALLAWVFSQVDWNEFGSSLAGINPLPVIFAFAAAGASLILVAVRWRMLLGVQDVTISPWESVRLTFLGVFFNTVVPGTVGGDLFKAYYVAKHTPNKAGVLVSTFVDRAIGMMGLALLSAIMLMVSAAGRLVPTEQLHKPTVAISVIACVLVFAAVFLFSRRFRRVLHLQKLYGRLPIAHHIQAAGEAANVLRRHVGKLLAALGITVICHLLFVMSILLLGAGLSLDVSWPQYFLYVPLIYVIGAVPITPGGIGLIEKLYVIFFAVNPSGVLALALLARMVPVLLGLPGLWVFLSGPRPPKASQIKHELEIDDSPAVVEAPSTAACPTGEHSRPADRAR